MVISDKKRFIFLHIFKTAGTSISQLFLPYGRLVDRITYKYLITKKLIAMHSRLFHLENEGQKNITGYHKHATAQELIDVLGRDKFDSYFTFCFVRNPYDHMISLYHYIKSSRGHRMNMEANSMSFEKFVIHYINQKPQTQSEFIYLGDERVVQFIGEFENLERDIQFICDHLGIPFKGLPHENSGFRNRDRMDYFKSHETLKAFNTYFEIDFLNFNYRRVDDLNHPSSVVKISNEL